MPMERLAVLAAIQTAKYTHHDDNNNTSEGGSGGYHERSSRYDNDINESVNVLLGAAMVSGIIIFVILSCYGCHKSVRKNRFQQYSLFWRPEPNVQNLEVFTTQTMCYGQQQTEMNHEEEATTTMQGPISLGPPPTYDSLIFNPHGFTSPGDKKDESIIPDETVEILKEEKPDEETEEVPAFKENEDLPTYEVALKLEADGYV